MERKREEKGLRLVTKRRGDIVPSTLMQVDVLIEDEKVVIRTLTFVPQRSKGEAVLGSSSQEERK